MKRLLVIIFLLIFVGVGFAQAPPFPPNPTVGEEVTGPDGQIYVWDGVKWARKIPGAYAPETKTSVTAPANPTAGQLWFDPINLQTYIWYTDPTSSQWVAIVNGATGGGGGGGGGPFLSEDNPTFTGVMTGPTLVIPNTASSSIYFGSATQPIGSLLGFGGTNVFEITGGMYYDGTNWVASRTSAENIMLGAGHFYFQANTGLTVGGPVTPTQLADLSAAGLNLTSGEYMVNGVPVGGGVGVWTRPTVFSFPSGWSDSGVLVYRSADGGKSIEIAGTLTGSGNPMNAGTNAVMFNIPDPLRPSKSVYAPLASQDAGFLRNIGATAQLNSNGDFRIFANTSLITVYVNLRLPVGNISAGQ